MKKRLNQYKGKLSSSEITDGMNAALQNAARLAGDANILLKGKRYPSATALAILSIEESGKVSILREIAVVNNDKLIVDCWRSYRSHTKKNIAWLVPQLMIHGARKLDDFQSLFDNNADHPYALDRLKQLSFYTDCLGDKNWSNPSDVVDEELARSIVSIANIFSKNKEIEPLEIELWVKHLGPVWMVSDKAMKKGLENWYDGMQKAGLASDGGNKMTQFIREGID